MEKNNPCNMGNVSKIKIRRYKNKKGQEGGDLKITSMSKQTQTFLVIDRNGKKMIIHINREKGYICYIPEELFYCREFRKNLFFHVENGVPWYQLPWSDNSIGSKLRITSLDGQPRVPLSCSENSTCCINCIRKRKHICEWSENSTHCINCIRKRKHICEWSENSTCCINCIRKRKHICDFRKNTLDIPINRKEKTTNEYTDKIKDYGLLWDQCENCYELNYIKYLKQALFICFLCGYHLQMNSSNRIEVLIDRGTWNPLDENMVSLDPIEFDSNKELSEKFKNAVDIKEVELRTFFRFKEFENEQLIEQSESVSEKELTSKEALQEDQFEEDKKEDQLASHKEFSDILKKAFKKLPLKKETKETVEFLKKLLKKLNSRKESLEKDSEKFLIEVKKWEKVFASYEEFWMDLSKASEKFSSEEVKELLNSEEVKELLMEFDFDESFSTKEFLEQLASGEELASNSKEAFEGVSRIYKEYSDILKKMFDVLVWEDVAKDQFKEEDFEERFEKDIWGKYLEETLEKALKKVFQDKKEDQFEDQFEEDKCEDKLEDQLEEDQFEEDKKEDQFLEEDQFEEEKLEEDQFEEDKLDKCYTERIDSYQEETGLTEAVQTGIGELSSIPLAIGVMDFEFMGGSMGSVVGEKITRLIEYSTNQLTPLLIVCASGGARMQEGSLSLMQMAKIASSLYKFQANKKLFYLAILTSPTTGGVTASFGMLGDIIIAEPNAYIAFAGKRVIEETLNTTVPEGSQETEYLFDKGLFDPIVPRNFLKEILSELFQLHAFFPSNLNGLVRAFAFALKSNICFAYA